MFTMAKVKDDNKTGNNFMFTHLSSNDYYSENEKIVGCWHGKLAEKIWCIWKRNQHRRICKNPEKREPVDKAEN